MMIGEKTLSMARQIQSTLERWGPNVLYSQTPEQMAAVIMQRLKNCLIGLGAIAVGKGFGHNFW